MRSLDDDIYYTSYTKLLNNRKDITCIVRLRLRAHNLDVDYNMDVPTSSRSCRCCGLVTHGRSALEDEMWVAYFLPGGWWILPGGWALQLGCPVFYPNTGLTIPAELPWCGGLRPYTRGTTPYRYTLSPSFFIGWAFPFSLFGHPWTVTNYMAGTIVSRQTIFTSWHFTWRISQIRGAPSIGSSYMMAECFKIDNFSFKTWL